MSKNVNIKANIHRRCQVAPLFYPSMVRRGREYITSDFFGSFRMFLALFGKHLFISGFLGNPKTASQCAKLQSNKGAGQSPENWRYALCRKTTPSTSATKTGGYAPNLTYYIPDSREKRENPCKQGLSPHFNLHCSSKPQRPA